MLDRTDAERWRDYMERAERHHADFASGRIGEWTYRAHLHGLGFRKREIDDEVALRLLERQGERA